MGKKYHFDTLALHYGQKPDEKTGSMAVPIYQTTSYVFKDADHAASLFEFKEEGHVYSRISNPTQQVLEERMAALEGGVGALALSSGQAAVALSVFNLAGAGDEIISSSNLYGGSFNLFSDTLKNFGIKTVFVDPTDIDSIQKSITPKTKLIFGETIGNPRIDVLDIESLAKIAHENQIPLIVDNTFATPYLCQPFEFGADIVVHSATKFIGGHGTTMGGIIVDSGNFDWDLGNFPQISSYKDIFRKAAYIGRARAVFLRDLGPCISPFNAFLLLQGLESLPVRVKQHCENAKIVTEYLSRHPKVSWINFPGLKDDPYHALASKYLSKGAGSIFTFGIKGGYEAGKTFIENLKLSMHLANIGDAKTLVIHPASTTHQQLSAPQLKDAGVTEDMIRVSIGLENVQDIIEDFDNAFKNLKS